MKSEPSAIASLIFSLLRRNRDYLNSYKMNNNRSSSKLIGCCKLSFFLAMVVINPVVAEELNNLSGGDDKPYSLKGQSRLQRQAIKSQFSISAKDLLVQNTEDEEIIEVTRIRLNQTDSGLQIILETATGQQLVPLILPEGNNLIIDILDATLALPTGNEFRETNPAEGIVEIAVTQADATSIQVIITGENNAPTAEVIPSERDLILGVTPEATAQTEAAEEIQIISTRREEPLSEVPRSITVIEREEIERQTIISNDIGDLLGTTVPGFAPPNQNRNTRGQTLRGREALILIDGIPVNSNFRVNRQELRSIDSSAVERIEVTNGPTAIFGGQGTGGVINIITRQAPTEGVDFDQRAGLNTSFSNLDADSLGNNFQATVAGVDNNVDYVFNFSQESIGSFFDGEGDRIADEASLSDTLSFNVLGKVGVNIGENQRLQFSTNYFNSRRDTNFIASFDTFATPGRQKAEAEELEDLDREDNPKDVNFLVSAVYSNENVLGGDLQFQIYYIDTLARGEFADGRPIPFGGREVSLEFFPTLFQSRLENQRWGTRLQLDTPFTQDESLGLLWGVDYTSERNIQLTDLFDEDLFVQEQQLRKIDELEFTPPYFVNNLGLFAQLKWEATDSLILSGGVRYENISVSIDDYTPTAVRNNQIVEGTPVEGGDQNPDDFVFNGGIVYNFTNNVGVFASIGQGFFIPDIGRALRRPGEEFVSVDDGLELTEPIKVTEYEIGFRGNFDNVQFTLAGFFNYSDNGSSLTPDEETGLLELERSPQRIYGVEATLDWQPRESWLIGTSFGWSEGENDPDDDGDYFPLNSGEIAPWRLTAYVENQTLPGWRNRLQFFYVGDRDRAFDEGVEDFPIESYLLVDLISRISIGRGELQIGVENLFNNQYFPASSQFVGGLSNPLAPDLPFDQNYSAGRGTTVRILYNARF